MEKEYESYVFDLYGTLADIRTEEASPALWRRFAVYLSLRGLRLAPDALRAEYLRLCGAEERSLAQRLARRGVPGPYEIDLLRVWQALLRAGGLRLTCREAEEVSLVFRSLSLRRLRLYPGAAALLSSLRQAGKRVVLLSNAQASFTLPELRRLGIADAFDHILLSSEAGVRKPSPAFFARLQDCGVRPGSGLMIGNDDVCDCRGAAAAGMDSLYLRTRQSPPVTLPLPERCRCAAGLDAVFPFGK